MMYQFFGERYERSPQEYCWRAILLESSPASPPIWGEVDWCDGGGMICRQWGTQAAYEDENEGEGGEAPDHSTVGRKNSARWAVFLAAWQEKWSKEALPWRSLSKDDC